MQGLVTLDLGNTNPHAGLFQKSQGHWKLVKVVPFSELSPSLEEYEMNPGNTTIVMCSVKERAEEMTALEQQGFLVTRVKDYWRGERFAGMPVHYAPTLGEDRLIQAYYVYKKLSQSCLIIDAGTFVTMDVVTKNGFEGGYITPNLANYLSLFGQGEQLKSVEMNHDLSSHLPHTTSSAMRDGHMAFGTLAQKLFKDYSLNRIFLTGGQAHIWEKIFAQLSMSEVVQVDSTLIHWALQYWMTSQIEIL